MQDGRSLRARLPIRSQPGAADLTVIVSFKTPAATTSMLLAPLDLIPVGFNYYAKGLSWDAVRGTLISTA